MRHPLDAGAYSPTFSPTPKCLPACARANASDTLSICLLCLLVWDCACMCGCVCCVCLCMYVCARTLSLSERSPWGIPASTRTPATDDTSSTLAPPTPAPLLHCPPTVFPAPRARTSAASPPVSGQSHPSHTAAAVRCASPLPHSLPPHPPPPTPPPPPPSWPPSLPTPPPSPAFEADDSPSAAAAQCCVSCLLKNAAHEHKRAREEGGQGSGRRGERDMGGKGEGRVS